MRAAMSGVQVGASDPRVLLVCMPMGLVQTPNLGLSLLKASLARHGISCDVRYLSVEFVEHFIPGTDAIPRYVRLVDQPHLSEVCASYFAERRFGPDPQRDALVARHLSTVTPDERELIASVECAIRPFLDYCLDSVPWERYCLVGFTTLFAGMTIPSAALARYVKARVPHLVTVLGGWNTGDEMGIVIAERLHEFDYVLRGESEDSFPELVRRVLGGTAPNGIPGLVVRDEASGRARSWAQALTADVDAIPFPDFSDYFDTMAAGRFKGDPPGGWSVPFESSRGCWWGAMRHCKFCGLNGLSMPFRSKTPGRLLEEIDDIVAKHHPRLLFAADTILDLKYFESVLPLLAERHPDVHVAYEVKAPVRREQMARLSKASVNLLTVGVESLSTRILQLMDKGTTYLKNVHCLRLAREFGIDVGWQYLYGFPAERWEDYAERVAQLRVLHHLPPPLQACPVTVARFSPYYFNASSNGLAAVRAHPDYRMAFPWDQHDLDRVAYHFSFEFADGRPPGMTSQIAELLGSAVERWRASFRGARLELHAGRSGGWIVDTRFDDPRVFLVDAHTCRVLQALDTDVRLAAVARSICSVAQEHALEDLIGLPAVRDVNLLLRARDEAERLGTEPIAIPSPFQGQLITEASHIEAGIVALAERLRSLGLIIAEHDRWLSLCVPHPAEAARPEAV